MKFLEKNKKNNRWPGQDKLYLTNVSKEGNKFYQALVFMVKMKNPDHGTGVHPLVIPLSYGTLKKAESEVFDEDVLLEISKAIIRGVKKGPKIKKGMSEKKWQRLKSL